MYSLDHVPYQDSIDRLHLLLRLLRFQTLLHFRLHGLGSWTASIEDDHVDHQAKKKNKAWLNYCISSNRSIHTPSPKRHWGSPISRSLCRTRPSSVGTAIWNARFLRSNSANTCLSASPALIEYEGSILSAKSKSLY